MAQGELIGTVDKGDTFYFGVSDRELDGTIAGTFNPLVYDVVDYKNDVLLSGDVAFISSSISGYTGSMFLGAIDTSSSQYVAGETYGIAVKIASGSPTGYVLKSFTVTKAGAQLDWIRNDIENVIFPRLKRMLGLLGENLLLDRFTYDDSHNITGMRIRLFSNTTDAQAATSDIDDTSLPEIGEIDTYRVDQDIDLPRSVRVKHLSYPDVDASDSEASENQGTDSENAPGNTGVFPS